MRDSGIKHMMSPLPATFAKGCSDLRNKVHEVEEDFREADQLKGESTPDEISKVVLMKIMFEDLRLHARRQGPHKDRHTYEESRPRLREQATIKDEERAAQGSLKQLGNEKPDVQLHEQGQWIEGACGGSAWVEADQIYSLIEGGQQ